MLFGLLKPFCEDMAVVVAIELPLITEKIAFAVGIEFGVEFDVG